MTSEDARAVEKTVRDGWVSSAGPAVGDFERRFAQYVGAESGAAVSSGTAALELALVALRIGPGDEVICPSLTIVSCARAILAVGATPVFVDVDETHYGLDVDAAIASAGPKTRAVLAVHLFGYPVNLDGLMGLRDRGVLIVEDAAQAIGSEVRVGETWLRCGAVGDAAAFSFYANKAITTGEGGMVVGKEAVADRARRAANLFFGDEERYVHDELGHNYRISALSAALGLSQLARIEAITSRKKAIEARYRDELSDVPGLTFPRPPSWGRSVPWMVAVVADEIDARTLMSRLRDRGVESRPFFFGLHAQPALAGRDVRTTSEMLVTERLSRHGLYLPSSLQLTDADIGRVGRAVRAAMADGTAA